MKNLKYGDRGSEVGLLQLALTRAGYTLDTDGSFGAATAAALREFQRDNGLAADGVAGKMTYNALTPWFTGYYVRTVEAGDTLFSLAQASGTTLRAIETANPGIDPLALSVGSRVVVPLAFEVVPTGIAWSSALVGYCARGITARYPFVAGTVYGESVMGKPLRCLELGSGEKTVFYNAEHHANEWITTPVLMKFTEQLARAFAFGGSLFGREASEIMAAARFYIAPAVNPDGMDLVTGALTDGKYYSRAREIAADFPEIPFPSGWKANIAGTDPNLQYPAGWERAKEIKYAQGFTKPAPRDYVGASPLSAPESRAVYELTRSLSPDLTLSYHTQGNVIYWKYLDFDPPGAKKYAECFAAASGYAVESTPYASGFAGYKDWFISEYDRPGYTVECGVGASPLPIAQFDEIYAANLGILVLGAVGC